MWDGLQGVQPAMSEICLAGPLKIPFTCSWLPGKSSLHITLWISLILVVVIVSKGADLELHALQDPAGFYRMIEILALAASFAWLRTAFVSKVDDAPVEFEEVPPWHIVTLDLTR